MLLKSSRLPACLHGGSHVSPFVDVVGDEILITAADVGSVLAASRAAALGLFVAIYLRSFVQGLGHL